jgi:hypothetical protein
LTYGLACFGGKFRDKENVCVGALAAAVPEFRGENSRKSGSPLIQRGKDGSTDSFVRTTHAMRRMVDFHGWMMPLHYGSQIDEHHAVRTDAGMFDVSP